MNSSSKMFLALLIVLSFVSAAALGQDVIKLRSGQEVSGKVVEHDENGFTLQTGEGKKQYKWEELDPRCTYELWKQFTDPTSAKAHFLLGLQCAMTGLIEEAKAEYRRAREIEPAFAEMVEKALKELESGGKTPGKEPAETEPPEPVLSPEQLLAKQRQDGQIVNEKLHTKLKTSETAHFIIHSDFTNPSDMKQIRQWCETLYERLSDVLDVKPGDKLWNGKCEIYLFLERADFVRYAKTFDKFPEAKVSGGYFGSHGRNCHIVIPRTDLSSDRGAQKDTFLYTLLHEGSHAYLQLHGNVVEIKPWLHEGFAQYFQFALPDTGAAQDRDRRSRIVKRLTSKPGFTRFNELRALEQLLGDDLEAYALSWSIVDYMINSDRATQKGKLGKKKFAKFIALIKDGKSEEDAMKEAYGQTPAELEQAWLKYVRPRR
jgi:hypothetical protein